MFLKVLRCRRSRRYIPTLLDGALAFEQCLLISGFWYHRQVGFDVGYHVHVSSNSLRSSELSSIAIYMVRWTVVLGWKLGLAKGTATIAHPHESYTYVVSLGSLHNWWIFLTLSAKCFPDSTLFREGFWRCKLLLTSSSHNIPAWSFWIGTVSSQDASFALDARGLS